MIWIIGLLGAAVGITAIISAALGNAARGQDYGESLY